MESQRAPSAHEKAYTLQSRKRPIFDRRALFFAAMALILFGILVALIIRIPGRMSQPQSARDKLDALQTKDLRELPI